MNFMPYKNKTEIKIPKIKIEALLNEKKESINKWNRPKSWNEVTQNLLKPALEIALLNFYKKMPGWNEQCENVIRKFF